MMALGYTEVFYCDWVDVGSVGTAAAVLVTATRPPPVACINNFKIWSEFYSQPDTLTHSLIFIVSLDFFRGSWGFGVLGFWGFEVC